MTNVEVQCFGVSFSLVGGDFCDLDGGFFAAVVEMEVDDLELEVGVIIMLSWSCLNGRLYFLWCLSQMFLEEKMSHIAERSFGIVIFYGAILF